MSNDALVKERFNLGNTRFYERRFPEKDELVMVKVVRVADMGAYVSLLEYDGLEGMILMSELSKRRIRSVKKIVRVGRHEVVVVLRVDKKKGYIDLSKKRVSPEEIAKCEERFSKSKKVHQIMCHIAQKYRISVEELNTKITWPLQKDYSHALDAFRDPDFSSKVVKELRLEPHIEEALVADIQLRLASHAMRMRVKLDVRCYGFSGVDAVLDALNAGKEAASRGDKDSDVKVKLIAPPQYLLVTNCFDRADGEKRLNDAIAAVEKTIAKYKGGEAKKLGDFLIIGGEDERLKELMSSEEEQEDGSSDDDSSSEEEEEDQGMGLVEENQLPEDQIEESESEDEKKGADNKEKK